MSQPVHPVHVDPELTEERLNDMAVLMLDVFSEALAQTKHDLDDEYTRGARSWAWIKNALLTIAEPRFDWLKIVQKTNDLQFAIGNSLFRFFCDNHNNPKKHHALNPTNSETLNFDLFQKENNGLWRFMIQKAETEDDEHSIYCLQYRMGVNEIIAQWKYDSSVRNFITTSDIPSAAMLPDFELGPRHTDIDEEDGKNAARPGSNE